MNKEEIREKLYRLLAEENASINEIRQAFSKKRSILQESCNHEFQHTLDYQTKHCYICYYNVKCECCNEED